MAVRLESHGLRVDLPARWEGAVGVAAGLDADAVAVRRAAAGRAPAMRPAAHLGNFPLPALRGDFGSGAVERMVSDNAFVALVEYGPQEAGTPLFSRRGLPRHVRDTDLDPRALQRTIRGQAGFQAFATEAGRAFSLYVVVGAARPPGTVLDEVNQVLATLRVSAA